MKIQTENMTAQLITKGVTKTLSIVVTVVCIGLLPVHAQGQVQAKAKTQYNVSTLPDFGGTSTGGKALMTRAGRQAIPVCRIGTGMLRCGETACFPISAHSAAQTAA